MTQTHLFVFSARYFTSTASFNSEKPNLQDSQYLGICGYGKILSKSKTYTNWSVGHKKIINWKAAITLSVTALIVCFCCIFWQGCYEPFSAYIETWLITYLAMPRASNLSHFIIVLCKLKLLVYYHCLPVLLTHKIVNICQQKWTYHVTHYSINVLHMECMEGHKISVLKLVNIVHPQDIKSLVVVYCNTIHDLLTLWHVILPSGITLREYYFKHL